MNSIGGAKLALFIVLYVVTLNAFVFAEDIRLITIYALSEEPEPPPEPIDQQSTSLLGTPLCRLIEDSERWSASRRDALKSELDLLFLKNGQGNISIVVSGSNSQILRFEDSAFSRQAAWDFANSTDFSCLRAAGFEFVGMVSDRSHYFGFVVEDRIRDPDSLPLEQDDVEAAIKRLRK